ncbi:Sec-independent protein translocase subunit TatA [Rothia sp. AR01]|uniref:Sec-independent protein translocase protein TatA n=1 Tax=Rothia santali TaxID=2949643 RepID=A0A9X2H7P0_9MICC|nr:Sec-independent protein translocase subunit TatA [Rothia santali]MCP3424574.1 Sec-independent protein translocase subunit TatA [Rothia santali]
MLLILLVLILLLFGAPKLPGMARSLGQSMRIFKSEVKEMKDEKKPAQGSSTVVDGEVIQNDVPDQETRGTDSGSSSAGQGTANDR